MGEGGDGLHFCLVALVERVVEEPGCINNLPAGEVVVSMADVEVLSGEGVRLHVQVGVGDVVDKATLSDVGKAGDQESALERVDGWHSCQVLANFVEVVETASEFFKCGAHAAKRGSFEHFASVEGVPVFEETAVVLGDVIDDVAAGVEVAESQLVVVFVVEDVDETGIKWVDVIELAG